MKVSAVLLASLFPVLFSLSAFAAAHQPSSGPSFEKMILQAQKSCPNLECAHNPVQVKPLSPTEFSRLDAPTKAALLRSMESVADIWPDTILEGGYETDFQLRLDQVEVLLMAQQQVGFRFTFSAAARDEDQRSGRIIERGFLSQDFRAGFRDETAMAHFQAGAL